MKKRKKAKEKTKKCNAVYALGFAACARVENGRFLTFFKKRLFFTFIFSKNVYFSPFTYDIMIKDG